MPPIFIAHTGDHITPPASPVVSPSLATYISDALGILPKDQVLLTERGRVVRTGSSISNTAVFLYDKGLLAKYDPSKPDELIQRVSGPQPVDSLDGGDEEDEIAWDQPPREPASPSSLSAWKDVFAARQDWCASKLGYARTLADTAVVYSSQQSVIQWSALVAAMSQENYIRRLERKATDLGDWFHGVEAECTDDEFSIQLKLDLFSRVKMVTRRLEKTIYSPSDQFRARPDGPTSDADESLDRLVYSWDTAKAVRVVDQTRSRFRTQLQESLEEVGSISQRTQETVATLQEEVNAQTGKSVAQDVDALIGDLESLVERVSISGEGMIRLHGDSRDRLTPEIRSRINKVCAEQDKLFPSIVELVREISAINQNAADGKNEAATKFFSHMSGISKLQSDCDGAKTRLSGLELPTESMEAFTMLATIRNLPRVWGRVMLEAVRRCEWDDFVRKSGEQTSRDVDQGMSEETDRQHRWTAGLDDFLSSAGRETDMLSAAVVIEPRPNEWPDISRDELAVYIEQLEAMQEYVEIGTELREMATSELDMAHLSAAQMFIPRDEVNLLIRERDKFEEEVLAQKSRVRKLEDLLHRQSQQQQQKTNSRPVSRVDDYDQRPMSSLDLDVRDTELAILTAKVDDAQAQVDDLVRLLERAREGAREAEEASGLMADRVAQVEAAMAQKDELLSRAEEKLASSVAEVSKVKSELDETKSEVNTLQSDLTETRTKLAQAESDLAESKAELSEAKADVDKTKTDFSRTETELAETKAELIAKSDQLIAAEAEISKAKAEVSDMKAEVTKATAGAADLIAAREEATAKLSDLDTELSKSRFGLDNMSTVVATTIELLKSILESNQGESEEVQAHNDAESPESQLESLVKRAVDLFHRQTTENKQKTELLAHKQTELEIQSQLINTLEEKQNSAPADVDTTPEQSATGQLSEQSDRMMTAVLKLLHQIQGLAETTGIKTSDLSWMDKLSTVDTPSGGDGNSADDSGGRFERVITATEAVNLDVVTAALAKQMASLETSADENRQEARMRAQMVQQARRDGADKIAFRNFKVSDLVLFLPARGTVSASASASASTIRWAAFSVGAPHYFLNHHSHHLEGRQWMVGRVKRIREVGPTTTTSTASQSASVLASTSLSDGPASPTTPTSPTSLSSSTTTSASPRWFIIDAVEEKTQAPATPGTSTSTVQTSTVGARGKTVWKGGSSSSSDGTDTASPAPVTATATAITATARPTASLTNSDNLSHGDGGSAKSVAGSAKSTTGSGSGTGSGFGFAASLGRTLRDIGFGTSRIITGSGTASPSVNGHSRSVSAVDSTAGGLSPSSPSPSKNLTKMMSSSTATSTDPLPVPLGTALPNVAGGSGLAQSHRRTPSGHASIGSSSLGTTPRKRRDETPDLYAFRLGLQK